MGVKLTKGDIVKTKGKFKPKVLITVIDELGELMSSDDFRAVSSIKSNMGSIGRLGRAAGCHMVLATQKASSGTVSSELMNNIHQRAVLGDFDGGVSSTLFEKDISHMSRPEIKGRGFMKSGSQLYEFQSYWTDPETDFVFEDKMLIEELEEYREKNPIKEEKPKENDSEKPLNKEEALGSRRPPMAKDGVPNRGFGGPRVAGDSTRRPPADRFKESDVVNKRAETIPATTNKLPRMNESQAEENQLRRESTRVEPKNQEILKENKIINPSVNDAEEKSQQSEKKKSISLVKEDENPLASRKRRAETISKLQALEINEEEEYKS